MMTQTANQPANEKDAFHVLLSREEILLLCRLVGVDPLPDPAFSVHSYTADEEALLLPAAERALRARELLVMNQEGNLLVHNALLVCVQALAKADRVLMVTDLCDGKEARRMYFYMAETGAILHIQPQSGLHYLEHYPHRQDLPHEILSILDASGMQRIVCGLAYVEQNVFNQALESATTGQVQLAERLLAQAGINQADALAIANLIMQPHRTLVFDYASKASNGSISNNQVTVLNGSEGSIAVISTRETGLSIRPVTYRDLEGLLKGWFL